MNPHDSQTHFCAMVVSGMPRAGYPAPVRFDRPPPGEALNFGGEATVPRQAVSIILLRGDREPEVLLVKRNPGARFMGGMWVFPGGAVDATEGEGDSAHRVAALRELREEAGVAIDDPAALVKFSRWVTPAEIVTRFDTHFFVAALPPGQEAVPDGAEVVDLRWLTPRGALDASPGARSISSSRRSSTCSSSPPSPAPTPSWPTRAGATSSRCSREWSGMGRGRGSSCRASPATRTEPAGSRPVD